MSKHYFVGKLTKRADGFFYLSGNKMPWDQEIEMFIDGEWIPHDIAYLGNKESAIYPADRKETRTAEEGKARIDIRNFNYYQNTKASRRDSINFKRLTWYLRENEIQLEQNQFKGVLMALDLIVLYELTKSLAVKIASYHHEVTQKFINRYIKVLDVKTIQEVQEKQNKSPYVRSEHKIMQDIEKWGKYVR